jgi:phosphosulfolactate synthase (CoM biosynthesis protein A)
MPLLHRNLSALVPRRGFASSARALNDIKSKTPFSFLPSNHLPSKPRKTGLTEIRGPYYAPVTKTYLDELLSDWGEFVDGVKFAGGAFSLMPEDRLRALIETAHKHNCYVSTGGFIEKVLSSSNGDRTVVERYLKTCKDLG